MRIQKSSSSYHGGMPAAAGALAGCGSKIRRKSHQIGVFEPTTTGENGLEAIRKCTKTGIRYASEMHPPST